VIRLLAAGAALLTLAACSSSGGSDPDSGGSGAADVSHAVCAKDATAKKVDLPSGFPSDFPLPPGTIVYSADNRGKSEGIVVTGVTSTPFKDVLKALQRQLPAHGFRAEDGETEPHDAESDWTSNGFKGRWAIREIPQCSGDTLVNVVARANS
jgi:uncharacterized lipoprotein